MIAYCNLWMLMHPFGKKLRFSSGIKFRETSVPVGSVHDTLYTFSTKFHQIYLLVAYPTTAYHVGPVCKLDND